MRRMIEQMKLNRRCSWMNRIRFIVFVKAVCGLQNHEMRAAACRRKTLFFTNVHPQAA